MTIELFVIILGIGNLCAFFCALKIAFDIWEDIERNRDCINEMRSFKRKLENAHEENEN